MSDATQARATEYSTSAPNLPLITAKAKTNTVYYAGTMQTVNSSGRATNPTSTSEIVAGVVTKNVDNNPGANDALTVELRTGPHWFALHADRPPTAADLLKPVYASDNQTISRTSSDGSLAGILLAVEGTKCCVWVGPPATAAAVLPGITAPALTENAGAIGGTNDGDLPTLTVTSNTIANNTGASPSTTAIVNLADGTTYATDHPAIEANFATLNAELTLVKADLADAIAAIREIATAYNTLRTNLTA